MSAPDSASERNRWATRMLSEAGVGHGFQVTTEHPVPGGRVDVVWSARVPWRDAPLPVVGFEIESSWRTRKHVKGDLLNLQDLGVALGVIVLLGTGPDVESLRRFARELVQRPGAPIEVWTEQDVRALVGEARPRAPAPGPATPRTTAREPARRAATPHVGKYRALSAWLSDLDQRESEVSFERVEQILGFELPPSASNHLAHWYGYDGTALGRAIRDAGWRATDVDLERRTVRFVHDD